MAKTAIDQGLLDRLARLIATAVRPQRIVLFGSWARGEQESDSDLDLFVQVDAGRDVGQATQDACAAIRPLRPELGRGVDIVVKDAAFVERYGDLVGTVVRPALREGTVLYER